MGANARTSYSASLAGERDGQATTDDTGADNNEDETTSTPDAPQSMPLEGECTGQSSGSSTGLTAREMTRPMKTGASARSTSHDNHQPDKSNESRLSEGPADTTGDDERHPDESTEPPDKPEGARWRSGELRAGTVKSKMPGEPRCAEAMGEISNETRQPGKPTEPPDEVEDARTRTSEPRNELRDRARIRVKPGGALIEGEKGPADEINQRSEETKGDDEDLPEVPSQPHSPRPDPTDEMPPHTNDTRTDQRHGANAHGEGSSVRIARRDSAQLVAHADEATEVEVTETHRHVLIEGEDARARAMKCSTTGTKHGHQHTLPEAPEDIPEPPKPPDDTALRRDGTPSTELEGEWSR
ncbi:hypothetical protein J3R82DRAFT_6793 [Butyriboletus roseoflavus]|nr:hypothetical protein J3R82DRAFT_6793 [Butyriboletus roseoflavus]